MSVQHKAKNIGTLAGEVVTLRAQTLFLCIIFFLLTLVNAVFAVVIGNLFVANPATTMDTGVRLQRYVVQEIAEIAGIDVLRHNLTLAGIVAVVIPLILALLPGGGEAGYTFGVLWQLFGTTNQLTAGLALTVIALWVLRRGRNPLAVLIPLTFLLVMTSWALIINLVRFVEQGEWVLATLDAVIFVLAMWLIVEAFSAISHVRAEGARAPEGAGSRGELADGDVGRDGRPPETDAEAAARRDTRRGPGA